MMGVRPGDVVNMGTFTAITDGAQWTFRRPGKGQTYVFLLLGVETKGEPPLDLTAAMEALGWGPAQPARRKRK